MRDTKNPRCLSTSWAPGLSTSGLTTEPYLCNYSAAHLLLIFGIDDMYSQYHLMTILSTIGGADHISMDKKTAVLQISGDAGVEHK